MTRKDTPNYWFKATAVSATYSPLSFEGGLYALTAQEAFVTIEARSEIWNVKHINTISIYNMKNGISNEDPVLFVNCAYNRTKSHSYPYYSQRKEVNNTKTLDAYLDATWAIKLTVPDKFPIIRYKEE